MVKFCTKKCSGSLGDVTSRSTSKTGSVYSPKGASLWWTPRLRTWTLSSMSKSTWSGGRRMQGSEPPRWKSMNGWLRPLRGNWRGWLTAKIKIKIIVTSRRMIMREVVQGKSLLGKMIIIRWGKGRGSPPFNVDRKCKTTGQVLSKRTSNLQ